MPIVVFIIFLVVVLTLQSNKTKRKKIDQMEMEEDFDPFKEIMKRVSPTPTIFPSFPMSDTVSRPERKFEPKFEHLDTPVMEKIDEPVLEEGVSVFKESVSELADKEEVIVVKEEEVTESKFNLRDAVIYSEILNRKY